MDTDVLWEIQKLHNFTGICKCRPVFRNLYPLYYFYKAYQSWNSMCNTKHTLLEDINVLSRKTKPTNGSAKLFNINNTSKNKCSRSRIIIIIS